MVSANARRARVPHRPAKRRANRHRYYTWAELLRRVYAVRGAVAEEDVQGDVVVAVVHFAHEFGVARASGEEHDVVSVVDR